MDALCISATRVRPVHKTQPPHSHHLHLAHLQLPLIRPPSPQCAQKVRLPNAPLFQVTTLLFPHSGLRSSQKEHPLPRQIRAVHSRGSHLPRFHLQMNRFLKERRVNYRTHFDLHSPEVRAADSKDHSPLGYTRRMGLWKVLKLDTARRRTTANFGLLRHPSRRRPLHPLTSQAFLQFFPPPVATYLPFVASSPPFASVPLSPPQRLLRLQQPVLFFLFQV